eukprot:NODE_198_length_15297_cov_0.486182.p14 type:complete len:126 gc:universal NODE_198_length_15297_cov_0.486182:4719-5096(+)
MDMLLSPLDLNIISKPVIESLLYAKRITRILQIFSRSVQLTMFEGSFRMPENKRRIYPFSINSSMTSGLKSLLCQANPALGLRSKESRIANESISDDSMTSDMLECLTCKLSSLSSNKPNNCPPL